METNTVALINSESNLRVSSVLNKDTKSYGKQYLADGKEETCWNSDQGPNQWIIVTFSKPVIVKQIELKFQGGFCSSKFQLESASHVDSKRVFSKLNEFYPQDINSTQFFEVTNQKEASDCYRLNFEGLTDFFGRVIVYNLQLHGYFV